MSSAQGAGFAVDGEVQQRAAGRGLAAADVTEQASRPVFGIEHITRGRIDVAAVAIGIPGEAHAQCLDQITLEPAQRPRQRQGFAVDRVQRADAVMPRREPQHQFVEIEAGEHRLTEQPWRLVDGLGALQLREFATLHAVETDVL